MAIKILTNIPELEHATTPDFPLEVIEYPKDHIGPWRTLKFFFISFSCQYFVINCSPHDVLIFSFLKWISPFNKCKIVSVDFIMREPSSLRERIFQVVKWVLFKKVHVFIEYFKDTTGYERFYKIPKNKFHYVPFKVNSLELINEVTNIEGNYLFCGGKTLRDFQTLILAFRNLPYELTIVTMSNEEISVHGSTIDESHLPNNIKVVRHD